MVHYKIQEESRKEKGLAKTSIFRIFGVSSTGYYNWLARQADHDGKRAKRMSELHEIQEDFRAIIKKVGFIPGKRTFRMYMWRNYNIRISSKRVKFIMNTMNLVAKLPKKDAYKGQATHFHECAAKQNHVKQQFRIAPRTIILTDITYLYYGTSRSLCYLCVFKDAYTGEVLGASVRNDMSVELVKVAYDKMMKQHGTEFKKNVAIYLHSDQGSQYLSTDFQQLLNDDNFIQSMSARGNSQDNAPMESFFGRMKTEVIDLIARCPNFEVTTELVMGYINNYNTQRYQYGLAGLTPQEYYQYCISGIYPLDNYFGVKSTDILSIEQLVKAKQELAKQKSAMIREKREAKEKEIALTPHSILARDQKKIKREIKKWERVEEAATHQVKKMEELLEASRVAVRFLSTATEEIKKALTNPQNWKYYKELDYVNDLGALY